MAGWSRQKRVRVEKAFYSFLGRAVINSKDFAGPLCLGENLYDGQLRFITAVFDALEEDIHDIYCLKSRQLGISTIARALYIFFVGIHPGIKGALVFDTAPHSQSARSELIAMIKDLPASLKFPSVRGGGRGNRDSLQLENDSTTLFMSAGVKKSKSSGTLGRSEGITITHMSELCSYDNEDGMKAFAQSLSEIHPDRLYIKESTARGPGMWKKMWEAARQDVTHCKCVFLGWWSKPSQAISRDDADFERYGTEAPTVEEAAKIKSVKEQYDHDITIEQLAWIRRKVDPNYDFDEDSEPDFEPEDTVMLAEQAWTEQEAFQISGSVFFTNKVLTEISNKFVVSKAQQYMFLCGAEFTDMVVARSENYRSTELKVWEEPCADGVYVMGVDPAYGENEENCRSAIEVFRCYSDGIDQVAEYAWPLITTRHLSWVLAALLGWYGSGRAEARYILELNGPGEATFNAIKELKLMIERDSAQRKILEEKGLQDVFRNVKTYIYSRPDSMGPGFNYHFKTTTQLKITLLERLRDFVSSGRLRVRSAALIEEMRDISRDGDTIGGERDDRVLSAAFAAYYWDTKIKPMMLAQKRSRESEAVKQKLSIVDQVQLFQQNQLEAFFKTKQSFRQQQRMNQIRQAWRYR